MEVIGRATPFARLVADALGEEYLTLVDIGCSGGIDDAWRVFGSRLRALAFDPNLNEITRLTSKETLSGVKYFPAFVGLPEEDEGCARMRAGEYWSRNPWARLSIARTLELRSAKSTDSEELMKLNRWSDVPIAARDKPVIIPLFLRERGVDDVDFVKIDVDGPDFLLLRSLVSMLDDAKVLGLGIEVNFFGSDDPETNTFHNVDRLMKQRGFELFLLTTRPYSVRALPAPYQLSVPAHTLWGRVIQGEAIYFRDAVSPENTRWAESVGEYKLVKLAALFSLVGLPDCAAEVLLRFHASLERVLDVQAGLAALTAQCVPRGRSVPSYDDYITQFEADARRFYPSSGASAEGLARALVALGAEPALSMYDEVLSTPAQMQVLGTFPLHPTVWPITIQTPVQPWSYGAVLSLSQYSGSGNLARAIVRIRTKKVTGELWVGALACDEKAFICRHMIPEGPENRETVLGPVDLLNVSKIAFENGVRSESSGVTVELASVLIPKGAG